MSLLLALLLSAVAIVAAGLTLWMAGAIYFDLSGSRRWGQMLAIAWVVSVLGSFMFWQPIWQPFLALLGLVGVFLGWWLRQKPSHDREWDATVALLPRVTCEGDAVTIQNLRNFEYRTLDDFTPGTKPVWSTFRT
jgi:hypothetical protein